MAKSKLFKVGGVSNRRNTGYKVRFANDMLRVKVLSKTDTDVQLIELPKAMSKADVVTFLKTTDLYQNAQYKVAIDASDAKYNPVAVVRVNGTKVTKAKTKAKAKPTIASIKAKVVAKTEAVPAADAEVKSEVAPQ